MTSTNFNVGMSLDRSSSKTNKNNDPTSSDSDSDDGDYVPSSKELRDDDRLSEQNSEDSEEEGSGDDDESSVRKRRKKSGRPSKRSKVSVELAQETEEESAQAPPNIDDLWNDFKKDCGVPNTAKPTPTIENKESDTPQKRLVAKEPKTKTVTELFEFAGETVEVKKEVPIETPETTSSSTKSAASTLPVRNRSAGGGLSSALGLLNKKNKLSILEKTKMDWNNFKEEKGIAEELEAHNKGKDGYLEKQDFLQRTDLRQFEIEKALRNSRRLK